ncbi:hypothetical protein D9613_006225 [Agrocybe pediades]|uniref:F-box domain-containing protein n=1 Tax=Agrocybe pediades TaxID=84607 RepID=A0A8H4QUW6_9AGAR|nr:hypothetical protein D9613_006225 [Agrocybe pediades]
MCSLDDRLKLALKLCQVCRTWCNIARSTPQLWTGISFYTFAGKRHPEQHLAFLKEQISRSKSLPLVVRCGNYVEAWDQEALPTEDIELPQVLAGMLDRCRVLYFFREYYFLDSVLSDMKETNVDPVDGEEKVEEKILGALREMTAQELPASTCIETIGRSPGLRSFVVQALLKDENGIKIPRKVIKHDNLEDLRLMKNIGIWNFNAVQKVLSRLELPRLREAFIQLECNFKVDRIVAFFARSSPLLTRLTLTFQCDGDPNTIALFREISNHLPCLVELSLIFRRRGSYTDTQDSVIGFISDSGRPRKDKTFYLPPLPLLQSLTYIIRTHDDDSDNDPDSSDEDEDVEIWEGWKFVPALFPVRLANGDPPSLRPLGEFSTDDTLEPSEEDLKSLILAYHAEIDFCELNEELEELAKDYFVNPATGSAFWGSDYVKYDDSEDDTSSEMSL